MSLFSISIITAILLGIPLFFRLMQGNKNQPEQNKILAWFVLFVVITLAGRYFYTLRPMTILWVKILFIGDFLIFGFGPLLYMYMQSLFGVSPRYKIKSYVHFIPLIAYVLLVLPLVLQPRESFINYLNMFVELFYAIEVFAILQNIFYLYLNYDIQKKYLRIREQNDASVPKLLFINATLIISGIAILLWSISFIVRVFLPENSDNFMGYQVVWFVLSILVLLYAYLVIIFPVLFKFEKEEAVPVEVQSPSPADYQTYIAEIERVMETSKPYLEPKITLTDLSELTGIHRNLLSKIINDHYGKNFFDYINSYRIAEFKSIAIAEANKNLTLLALAYQSGFNSKTTFNTAFKKLTKQTPGEFLKLAE